MYFESMGTGLLHFLGRKAKHMYSREEYTHHELFFLIQIIFHRNAAKGFFVLLRSFRII